MQLDQTIGSADGLNAVFDVGVNVLHGCLWCEAIIGSDESVLVLFRRFGASVVQSPLGLLKGMCYHRHVHLAALVSTKHKTAVIDSPTLRVIDAKETEKVSETNQFRGYLDTKSARSLQWVDRSPNQVRFDDVFLGDEDDQDTSCVPIPQTMSSSAS